MGSRAGLTKLDRTNGFDDGRDYMKVKKSKLALQNEEIRVALRNRHSTIRTDIFKGISINVNGRTQPTADELKRLILLNGGEYHPYYRYQTTNYMIATNLSTARIKNLRPDDRIVKPEWITESVQAKCLLPYEDYQIFADEPRGKTGSVMAVESAGPARKAIESTSSHRTIDSESDSSNGPIGIREFMEFQKSKPASQTDQIQEALRHRLSVLKTNLFKGISIIVLGPTHPTADELKRMILLNGGEYHPFYRYQKTKFIIATSIAAARIKTLRPDDKVVRPDWITDSLQVECLLPYEDYQITADELPRNDSGSNLSMIEPSSSSGNSRQTGSSSLSSDANYRKSKRKIGHPVTKSRDIRDYFYTQI